MKNIMSKDIVSVDIAAAFRETSKRMVEKDIDSVVVKKTRKGKTMNKLKARDMMKTKVFTVKSDWSLHRLAEFFLEKSISGAPVTSEESKLIGVVSLKDLISQDTVPEKDLQSFGPHEYYMYTLENHYATEEIASFHLGNEPSVTVRDIMTPMIYKVGENARVQKVADLMIRNQIHRVFVTREEKIVGIVSAVDLLKIVRDM